MRVKQIINTSITANGWTYTDPVELNEYPFNDDGVLFYVNHNQSGGVRLAKIQGRLHPDAPWLDVSESITNTNTTKWYTDVPPCPYYRVAVFNSSGATFTIEAHMLR